MRGVDAKAVLHVRREGGDRGENANIGDQG